MKRSWLPALTLMFSLLAPAVSQQPASAPQQQDSSDEDDVVRISTNLVQIDAVVTDAKDKQVINLEASDFELLEDGKPQQITNFSYVNLNSPEPLTSTGPAEQKGRNIILPPPMRLRPEQVRRTMALVVDDLGLSFESMVAVRRALRKFVDEEMGPNDLVAVVLTSTGSGALQQFTADKRRLYAAIDHVRWYPFGRSGINSLRVLDLDPLDKLKARLALPGGAGPAPNYSELKTEDEKFRDDTTSLGTLGSIRYIIQGMRELPGRKSVLLLSDGIKIFNPALRGRNSNGNDTAGRAARDRDASIVSDSMRRLTDLANRASVVIYTMDAHGLTTLGLSAVDNADDIPADYVRSRLDARRDDYSFSQEGLNYLAQQTGGFFVHNTNDITGGIRKVFDDQRGYYLIGYRPDPSTFDRATGARQFHRLAVHLKRPGLKVRTRTGFFGVTDAELRSAPRTGNQQLAAALESPFNSGDLRLRLTSLFGDAAGRGSFMRNLIHIDGHDLSFTDEPNGWHKVSFDIVAVTFGEEGEAVDKYGRTETMRMSDVAYQQARQNGLIYTLDVPIKKAGAYQLRIAVRDVVSSRVGSANQFIEVPDLSKNRLALSGLTISGFNPQQRGQLSNAAPPSPAAEADTPDPQSNPAVRHLRPGMGLLFAFLIYNAKIDEKTHAPRLLTQVRLFREGHLVFTGEVYPYEVGAHKDLRRLPMTGTLQFSPDARPGEYQLQVIVTDQAAEAKYRTVTNWTDLEIVN